MGANDLMYSGAGCKNGPYGGSNTGRSKSNLSPVFITVNFPGKFPLTWVSLKTAFAAK